MLGARPAGAGVDPRAGVDCGWRGPAAARASCASRWRRVRRVDLEPIASSSVPIEVRTVVDELNRLFATIALANRSQQQFLESAAHQLRTPLAGVQAQLELLMAEEPRKCTRERLALTLGATRRLTHTTQQLLALARSEHAASTFSGVPAGGSRVDRGILRDGLRVARNCRGCRSRVRSWSRLLWKAWRGCSAKRSAISSTTRSRTRRRVARSRFGAGDGARRCSSKWRIRAPAFRRRNGIGSRAGSFAGAILVVQAAGSGSLSSRMSRGLHGGGADDLRRRGESGHLCEAAVRVSSSRRASNHSHLG